MDNQRPDDLRGLYTRVFGAETDRIPLIVTPPCAGTPPREALIEDTAAAVAASAEAMAPKVAAGSDWIPTVNIAWYQCIVVPSLFGAEPVFQPGCEPVVEPYFQTVREAVDAGTPPVEGPWVDRMLQTLAAARAAMPDGWSLSYPVAASPFDLAQLLLPTEEYLAGLVAEPELSLQFLDNLATLCIRTIERTRDAAAASPGHVTNRGLFYPGIRLACDAIVNFSPGLIRRVVPPVLGRFAERFGSVCVHYCSAPAPSRHVLGALVDCPPAGAVDTWQGPDAFLAPDAAPMQSRVALIFDVNLTGEEKMDAFLDRPPIRDVPRRGGRGLVVHTPAGSVEDAKRIYAAWREKTVR